MLHVLGQSLVAAQQLTEGDDRRQRIVQLMGHAGHQDAQGLHLLRLKQLSLQAFLIGQVAYKMQEAALAAQLHDSDLDLHGELGAVRPAASVPERAATLGPYDLPAAGHFPLVRGDELAKVAAHHFAAAGAILAYRRLVGVQDCPVEGGDEQGVRRLLEQGSIALLGRSEPLA